MDGVFEDVPDEVIVVVDERVGDIDTVDVELITGAGGITFEYPGFAQP